MKRAIAWSPAFVVKLWVGPAADLQGDLRGHVQKRRLVLADGTETTTERQKIEGYEAHKWGLTGNLDAGHPYKNSAPTV
jgi:hypothetical protein